MELRLWENTDSLLMVVIKLMVTSFESYILGELSQCL